MTQGRVMISKFDRELDPNCDRFGSSITEQIQGKLGIVYEDIDRNLVDLFQYVGDQAASAALLLEQFQSRTVQSQSIAEQSAQLSREVARSQTHKGSSENLVLDH